MKCDFEFTDETNDQGWRYVRCTRPGCWIKGGPTPDELQNIHCSQCQAFPRLYEFGYWLAFALEVVGLSKQRWGWIRWKLGLQEPTGCNSCEARERWLNTLGGRLVTAWRRFTAAIGWSAPLPQPPPQE